MFRRQLPPQTPFISLIALAIYSLPAGAATFTVINLNDNGPGSLRQAILDANATAGDDTVNFQNGLSGTITLSSGVLSITSHVVINGPGAGALAISGKRTSRVFLVDQGAVATIQALTVKEGRPATGDGGGIFVYGGTLTVDRCVISNNSASNGGGIGNQGGALTITNSTVFGNSAQTFAGGVGSGDGGAMTIVNSTLYGNYAGWRGGGIYNFPSNSLSVYNSTLTGNQAADCGGGIGSDHIVTIANSLVSGNTIQFPNPLQQGIEVCNSGSSIAFASQGHNLFGENGQSRVSNAVLHPSDRIPSGSVNTVINPVTNNGGPTPTLLPVPDGPAINAGDNALIPAGVTTDQRGTGFPRIVNETMDIGAAEVQPPSSVLAGLTSAGQIYYTVVTPTGAGDGLLVGETPNATYASNAWTYVPGQLARLSVGDFNGDGEGDLAGIAGNGSIWYTTERGAWTQVPGGLSQISVGDFNGDGQDDLVGLAGDGSIWYTPNLSVWFQVPGQLAQIQVGDLNGDGQDDLAGIAGNGSVWYTTDLSVWAQAPGQLAQLQVGDLNGDGKADLAGLASNGSVWYTTDLSVWTQAPGQLAQLQVGDFNGDGKADLVGVAGNSSVWYTTSLSVWTQLPGALSQLTTSDLNGDGKVDLVGLANNGSIWYATDLSAWTNLPGQLAQLAGR